MKQEPKYFIPSNGTEGEMFMDTWCSNCRKDTMLRVVDAKTFCTILTKSMVGEQPKQWIYDENGNPTCLSFVNYRNFKPPKKRIKRGQLLIQF